MKNILNTPKPFLEIISFILILSYLNSFFSPLYGSPANPKPSKEPTDYSYDKTFKTIKSNLTSNDPLLQDKAVISIAKLQELAETKPNNTSNEKEKSVLEMLTRDRQVIDSAINIVDDRLLGWYEEDNAEMYSPLLYLLGNTDNKRALQMLVKCFTYLGNNNDLIKATLLQKGFPEGIFKRLDQVKSKMCCLYPGRDLISDILEKDMRNNMLKLFEEMFRNGSLKPELKNPNRAEIKKFVIDCMQYGDYRNGCFVRIKAVEFAGEFIKSGDRDMIYLLKKISKNDPCYVHKSEGYTKNHKPIYNPDILVYPVREKAIEVLSGIQ